MRDRDLVRLYWPAELRPAFDALMDIDEAMADVVAGASQPALAAITLAWWRDALNSLDAAAPPAEPRLQAVARELLPRGVSGASLATIAEGWSALLDAWPDAEAIAERGTGIFAAGACLLGASDDMLGEAGSLVAFANAKRRGLGDFGHLRRPMRFARPLRPLTALAALAARDLRRHHPEPEATPGRAWTLLRHRLTGRL